LYTQGPSSNSVGRFASPDRVPKPAVVSAILVGLPEYDVMSAFSRTYQRSGFPQYR
jgi:hypothetical protein